jgi:hypothetical protein
MEDDMEELIKTLTGIRVELEESVAPADWPQGADREVYLLSDVCRAMGLDLEAILGSKALAFLQMDSGALEPAVA